MTKMSEGARKLTGRLYQQGKVQGMIALGGTMGTDLALEVASALPPGVPKFVVSTVAFSHLHSTGPHSRRPDDELVGQAVCTGSTASADRL